MLLLESIFDLALDQRGRESIYLYNNNSHCKTCDATSNAGRQKECCEKFSTSNNNSRSTARETHRMV